MTSETSRAFTEWIIPGVHDVFERRYGHLLPGMADTIADTVYGEFYCRPGLDLKSRYVSTIAALAALGGQTGPQLRINIEGARKSGMSEAEIAEVIWQMALYDGLPAAINALHTMLEVFGEEPDHHD